MLYSEPIAKSDEFVFWSVLKSLLGSDLPENEEITTIAPYLTLDQRKLTRVERQLAQFQLDVLSKSFKNTACCYYSLVSEQRCSEYFCNAPLYAFCQSNCLADTWSNDILAKNKPCREDQVISINPYSYDVIKFNNETSRVVIINNNLKIHENNFGFEDPDHKCYDNRVMISWPLVASV